MSVCSTISDNSSTLEVVSRNYLIVSRKMKVHYGINTFAVADRRVIPDGNEIISLRITQRKDSYYSLYARHYFQYKVALETHWE